MTDHIRKTSLIRSEALKAIRLFFDSQGYIEIDAPVLIPANAVESHVDPLYTFVEKPGSPEKICRFLLTSPEIHMKRLLAHGLEKIYFLGHVFRDREHSPVHRTEFMMLEWYQAGSNLDQMISACEKLFVKVALAINGTTKIKSPQGHTVQLSDPFERISMAEAWGKFAQIDLMSCLKEISQGNSNALAQAVVKSGEPLREHADFEDAFTHIMLKKIEPRIGKHRPCVLSDWPSQTAALAALNPQNPLIAQRFEIYCGGMELANAFSELIDSAEQRIRFDEANEIRINDGRNRLPIDEGFLVDLQKMPAACGIAIGIDRLIALICSEKDLEAITCLTQNPL